MNNDDASPLAQDHLAYPTKILLDPGQLFQVEAKRRWPEAILLGGEGGRFAVVSHCFARTPTVSFHRDKFKARACKRELDRHGCSRDWERCRVWRKLGSARALHVVVDLGPACMEHVVRGWWKRRGFES